MHCWKALIALYERDLPFTAELVEPTARHSARCGHRPSIPLLVDDRVVIPDSSIIVEHLDRHGDAPPLIPTDPTRRCRCDCGIAWPTGTSPRPCKKSSATHCDPPDSKDPHGVSQAHATLDLAYATLDRRLNGRDHDGWLAGDDFTLADYAEAPALHHADVLHPPDRDAHRALAVYFDRVLTRSSAALLVEEARPHRELFRLP